MIENVRLCLTQDGTPILGGIFKTEEEATEAVKKYISLAKQKQNLLTDDSFEDISLEFIRQVDKRFMLIVNFGPQIGCIEELANIDELMLRRFKKSLAQKAYFILTSFYEEEGKLVSAITRKSLGLIIYKS